jgi:hypothetical protein
MPLEVLLENIYSGGTIASGTRGRRVIIRIVKGGTLWRMLTKTEKVRPTTFTTVM